MTQDFSEKPTISELRSAAEKYVKSNNIGVPIVSLSVSFAQLEKTEEYKNLKLLERVSLFDTVNVEFPALKVSATAKAVKIVYNVLLDRVENITLGSVRSNLADTIVQQQQQLKEAPTKTFLELAIESLTKSILGAKGGSVRLLDTDDDGEPDTLYIADNPDPEQAVKVWRFNYEGWGASQNGYNGPFTIGASFESGILAEFITAGTLYGMLIKAGLIESLDGKISLDLSNGNKAVFNSGIVSNDIAITPKDSDFPLFRVYRVESYEGWPESFAMDGHYPDGNLLFGVSERMASDGSIFGSQLTIYGRTGESAGFIASSEGQSMVLYSSGEHLILGMNNLGDPYLKIPGYLPMTISWKLNEDGTYTLIGED